MVVPVQKSVREESTQKEESGVRRLFSQTQKIGMSLVAASEDDTSYRNGKPSTLAHLTSPTSTIITTRENLHLAITSVLRMLHLPRGQQFLLGLDAFF